jgi:hypothetical protein
MMKLRDRAGDSRTASPELLGDLVVREILEIVRVKVEDLICETSEIKNNNRN